MKRPIAPLSAADSRYIGEAITPHRKSIRRAEDTLRRAELALAGGNTAIAAATTALRRAIP